MRHTNPSDHESGAFYRYLKSIGVDPYAEMRRVLDMIGTKHYEAKTLGFVPHTFLFRA